MTARDEAIAASYHADTMAEDYKRLYDVAEKLAAALDSVVRCHDALPGSNHDRCLGVARAALEAWEPYRPVWEVTG